MPRRTRLLATLVPAILALTLAGCGGGSTPQSKSGGTSNNLTSAFPLATASLPAYTADYDISGAAKGTMRWTIASQGQKETLVTIHQQLQGSVEDDRIVLTRQGLRFVSAQEELTSPGHRLTISAHLQGKQIVETANVDGKAESVNYPYGKQTLVNVAVLPILAGLNLQPGQLQIVQNVLLKHGVAVPIGFTANDKAKVTTPAGTFDCVPVTLSGSGPNQKAFIDTKNHVMVRYLNGQTTITLVQLTQ